MGQWTVAASEIWQGSLAETTLRVETPDSCQTERLVAILSRFFAVRDERSADWPAIRLVLSRSAELPPLAHDADELPSASPLRVWRTTDGFRFRLADAAFTVHERDGRATGRLPDDFWSWSPLRQRGLLLVVLLAQLAAHRRYGLHASAVDGDHGGVLIVGDSGSGKSTLAVSLVSQGWRYVADDAVALRAADVDASVKVLAVRRSLSCGPETVRHLPELRSHIGPGAVQADGKCLIDPDAAFPGQSASWCLPRAIVFPEIGSGDRSDIEALSGQDAVLRLLAQTSVGTACRDRAAEQLDLLRRLLQQARCWRLRLGSDVHTDRGAVSTLLEQAASNSTASPAQ